MPFKTQYRSVLSTQGKLKGKSRNCQINGKVCWWFVLHDDEANLCDIDTLWEQVQLQISWKLYRAMFSFHLTFGRLYSVEWTSGMEWWNGILE